MAAHMAYLVEVKGLHNFFILTPGETIYRKTISNFTLHDPRSVIDATPALQSSSLITGEDYWDTQYKRILQRSSGANIFVFNIQKIWLQSARNFQFQRLQENLGTSFAKALSDLDDLVIFMDESHRYRAPASLAAIEQLRPLLGLEYTATPASKNVLYEFGLNRAIGRYVKTPRVLARSDRLFTGEQEGAKLHDGFRSLERKQALSEQHASEVAVPAVKAVMFVVAQTIDHADGIAQALEDPDFEGGCLQGKVLTITQASEEEQIRSLVALGDQGNPYRVVIHVNRLKEGWDVQNIWTIVPLRASISDVLTEQTIGRGLRLPYGELTGEPELDTLDIVSHDRYAEVVSRGRKWIEQGVQVVEDQDADEPRLISVTVSVSAGRETWLNMPRLEPRITSTFRAQELNLVPRVRLETNEQGSRLVGTEMLSGERVTLGDAWDREIEDAGAYFTRALVETCKEVNPADGPSLHSWVQDYLDRLKCSDETLWHFGDAVVSDLAQQVKEQVEDSMSISFASAGPPVIWGSFTRAVDPERQGLPRDDDYQQRALFSGYRKQPFDLVGFDSKPEKLFADVLEEDSDAARWVRPPRGQTPIIWRGGSYNVDFVVETSNGPSWLVEIKDARSVREQDRDVMAKAAAAEEWAAEAGRAAGRAWRYALVPETAVRPGTATLKGALAQAVKSSVYASSS